MACTLTINGRAFPCKDKIGGIKRVWIKQFDATDWGTITAGVVAAGTAIDRLRFRTHKELRFIPTSGQPLQWRTELFSTLKFLR